MFWASSYNLFVTWAANGQHPWDNLPGSHAPSATLEIGALRGHSNKVTRAMSTLHSPCCRVLASLNPCIEELPSNVRLVP